MSLVDSELTSKVSVVAAPTVCCDMVLSLTSTPTSRGGRRVNGGDTANVNEIMAPAAAKTPLKASSFIVCMAKIVCPVRGTEKAKCACLDTAKTAPSGGAGPRG